MWTSFFDHSGSVVLDVINSLLLLVLELDIVLAGTKTP